MLKTATCKHFHSLSEFNYAEPLKWFPLCLVQRRILGGIAVLNQTGLFHNREMGGRKKTREKKENTPNPESLTLY